MSYTMVYQTAFIKLSDGRLLHLDRSGCNNDDAGRVKDVYTPEIITRENLEKRAAKFCKGSIPYKDGGPFDLKIMGREASMYDYGAHLLRMADRAVPYETFIELCNVRITKFDGIHVIKPVNQIIPPDEVDKVFYKYLYGNEPFSYKRLESTVDAYDEAAVIAATENEYIEIYARKKVAA